MSDIEIFNKTFTITQIVLATISLFAMFFLIYINKLFFNRKKIRTVLGIKNSRILSNFFFVLIFFLGILSFSESLGFKFNRILNIKILLTQNVKIYLYHLLILYLIIVGTKVLIILLEFSFNKRYKNEDLEKGKAHSFYLIAKYFIYVIAITIFVESLGFNVTILIASLSALLIGVGFGIQDVFKDLVSGFIILFERTIKVGDIVELNNGIIGRVSKIRLRSSVLITRNDVEIIVPNSKFIIDNIINWTLNSPITRHYIDVGVAYGSDVRLVESLLLTAAKSSADVSEEVSPSVQFIDFADSALQFRLFFYSQNNFRIEKTKSDIRFQIDKLFRENNIQIPFPQRVIHLNTKND